MPVVAIMVAALFGQVLPVLSSPAPAATPPSGTTGNTPSLQALAHCAFPPIAVRLNMEGTTVLDIEVTPQGTVAHANVARTSGFAPLDAAAMICVKTWTYSPATQNGAPIGARTKASIGWTHRGGVAPASHPLPPPGPPGWSEDPSLKLGGTQAYYNLMRSDEASNQIVNTGIYGGYDNLDELIASNHKMLEQINGAQIVGEARITICGGEPAWQVEYTRPWPLPADSNPILDFEQVASVRDGFAYVSAYIRPIGESKRPEAEQWIRSYCDSGK